MATDLLAVTRYAIGLLFAAAVAVVANRREREREGKKKNGDR